MTTESVILSVVLLCVVVLAAVGLFLAFRRPRRADLEERFGPEYERALEEHGDPSLAERDLRRRARRVDGFRLRDLSDEDRTRFSSTWASVQTRFVDDPNGAVHEADSLIKTVMLVRGYPIDDFEQRVADLSVHHANVVQHYRAARALAARNQAGVADTEELRQAFVHYRVLFAELLGAPSVAPMAFPQEARL
jgi:hypothetical protein